MKSFFANIKITYIHSTLNNYFYIGSFLLETEITNILILTGTNGKEFVFKTKKYISQNRYFFFSVQKNKCESVCKTYIGKYSNS